MVVKLDSSARFITDIDQHDYYQFMTASPSSSQQYRRKNKFGSSSITSAPAQSRLQIISSQGQLQVYASPHRGSFSVVLSEALRSAGLGSKVLIAQFLKGGVAQGPSNTISLCANLQWLRPDVYGCINEHAGTNKLKSIESQKNCEAIKQIWNLCKELLQNNSLDKIVLDEIGLAVEYGYINEKDLITVLENRHESIDLILTGPSIPSKVFSMADQITQLRNSK